jgi:hypothetical protein
MTFVLLAHYPGVTISNEMSSDAVNLGWNHISYIADRKLLMDSLSVYFSR